MISTNSPFLACWVLHPCLAWWYRWQISHSVGSDLSYEPCCKISGKECSSIQSLIDLTGKEGQDKSRDKEKFQRDEWFGAFLRVRNDAIVILSIICLQLPFELAYAHLYEVMESDVMK